MEKEQFRGTNAGHRISHLCFGVPDPLTIRRHSHLQCINNSLYDSSQSVGKNRKPAPYGVLDNRLGECCCVSRTSTSYMYLSPSPS